MVIISSLLVTTIPIRETFTKLSRNFRVDSRNSFAKQIELHRQRGRILGLQNSQEWIHCESQTNSNQLSWIRSETWSFLLFVGEFACCVLRILGVSRETPHRAVANSLVPHGFQPSFAANPCEHLFNWIRFAAHCVAESWLDENSLVALKLNIVSRIDALIRETFAKPSCETIAHFSSLQKHVFVTFSIPGYYYLWLYPSLEQFDVILLIDDCSNTTLLFEERKVTYILPISNIARL